MCGVVDWDGARWFWLGYLSLLIDERVIPVLILEIPKLILEILVGDIYIEGVEVDGRVWLAMYRLG